MEILPNDIKNLTIVYDVSIYYFSIIILILVLSFYFTTKYLLKKFNNREKIEKKLILEILHNLDWANGKESAYKITEYGRKISQTEKSKQLLDEVIELLNSYKYKKLENTESISENIKIKVNLFCQVVENE